MGEELVAMQVPPFVFVRNGYLASLLVEKHLQNLLLISLAINAERIFPNGDFFPSESRSALTRTK